MRLRRKDRNRTAPDADDDDANNLLLKIPTGHYRTAEVLVKEIDKVLQTVLKTSVIEYNPHSQKISVDLGQGSPWELKFSDGLSEVLGLAIGTVISPKIGGQYPIDVNHGIHSFFVYCDICEYQIVGDQQAPLLRIVPIDVANAISTTKTMIFDNPHYVPLLKTDIDHIEIHIRDDSGVDIPFTKGKTVVKLHFRAKRPNFL